MQTDPKLIQATSACSAHARALVESAKVVSVAGHANIAYHLALLALEELGRRELIGIQFIAKKRTTDDSPYVERQLQNHVDKLFWCFFSGSFGMDKVTRENLEDAKNFARVLHEKRLAGLYVENSEGGLKIPAQAISREECENLIRLAEARLGMAEAEIPREIIPNEELELQSWFLKHIEKPEIKRFIFSNASLDKLHELKNAGEWTRWVKAELDREAAENLELTKQELRRGQEGKNGSGTLKWKVRVKILSASHSIRPKALNYWNQRVNWIKLSPISGKKQELYVDILLPDTIEVQHLWYLAWGVARQFTVALNIGTMGYWWWRLPIDVESFYESIEDIQNKRGLRLTRAPSLKVDWGENRALSEEDMDRVITAMAALPVAPPREDSKPLDYYSGGLTFLSLNDVHWQCETNIFGNFFEALRWMMHRCGDWSEGTPFAPVHTKHLSSFHKLDYEDGTRFEQIAQAFEEGRGIDAKVTIKEASFEKLFCDAYFLKQLVPVLLEARRAGQNSAKETLNAAPAENVDSNGGA